MQIQAILTFCRVGVIASLSLLAACAPNISPDNYNIASMSGAENVVHGRIVSMRIVQVQGDNNGVGGLAGAVAGGALGSAIGGGTRANVVGAVGGAVAGGLLGNVIQKGVSKTTGVQYIVKTTSGKTLAVVQSPQPALSVGQRVLVILGNPARVIADT